MRAVLLFRILFLLTSYCNIQVAGQGHQERYNAIDVLNYSFKIDLNDTSDIIRGNARIKILLKTDVDKFYLDFTNKDSKGVGMVVEEVLENGNEAEFIHRDNRLVIKIPHADNGTINNYQITYKGIPSDGLIISENRFGDRTFFGDNWPDRAHHWLPVVDHPSDKALVEFLVDAPGHYGVVAIGSKLFETHENGRIFSHWKTSVPLPTKLMVIGVSPFAVQQLLSTSGIPVSSWVYPQNREEGFHDYSIAVQPLNFFESYIGPYPFTKLANVQSKTVFGGMENASCIFYNENTVTGRQENELLIAHEVAHQWFGDAVSEMNWHHIWLSEGFATYLADLYMQHIHGNEIFVASLRDGRNKVINHSRIRYSPVVDTSLAISAMLLNTNSYEKAGWFLHMLRRDLGDDLFQQCVNTFYETFKFSNALTQDFQQIVESISGKAYGLFFHQWLYQPGHPVLSANWTSRRNRVTLQINQHQGQSTFTFPLDIEFYDGKGNSLKKTFNINARKQQFRIRTEFKPFKIKLDPDTWLLFELH